MDFPVNYSFTILLIYSAIFIKIKNLPQKSIMVKKISGNLYNYDNFLYILYNNSKIFYENFSYLEFKRMYIPSIMIVNLTVTRKTDKI